MPTMTDKYNAKEDKKNLFMLQRMYEKTKLDGSFQRWGGIGYGSGWKIDDAIDYIENFLSGGAFNKIVVVDANEALKYCKEINDTESIAYFTKVISDEYEYISIDGNNSTSFLSAFISGEESLAISDCEKYATNPITFDEMSEQSQQDILYTEKVEVVILRNITTNQMCKLFRDLNKQTKLNNQEHRQARMSPLAEEIRNYGVKAKDFFVKFCFGKDTKIDQRVHEEMLAQFALRIKSKHTSNTKNVQLDSLYRDSFELPADSIRCLNVIVDKVRELDKAIGGTFSKRLTRGQVMTLFEVINIICVEEKFKIDDDELFFDWFLNKDATFSNESKSIPEEHSEERSYTFWLKFFSSHKCYNNTRDLFRSAFYKDMEKLIEEDIISSKRTSKDTYKWKDTLELYHKQEGKLRTGDRMRILDLYLGKYEVDHMKSFKDGGETSIENGELMTVLENRQKGSKSNEPHFPHQRQ